ncbi:OmpH family outer membrane protein [Bdellovibrio bacteriovorus]|uniref:OmpH family outer membrane protein n=1 Tax=Bdellovibrio reynosensis TaxID=2835041 RepID=A0ABY4CFT7_9BACT|nr:OmpH family outer membrane protein [Bdellovibrio reynosensis]UOF02413.1 OmpH family outer membrane protein [Bdellovibrio reynosensis]
MKNLLIVLSMLMTASFAHAADAKVGYVDMQKAIQSTSAGKKAKTELEGEFNKKKKELEKKEADLKKMGEDLEKKKSVLSEEALGKKQAEFQEEMLRYRDVVGKSQLEIQKKERELTAPILEKMKKVIAKLAKDKGYTMVIENSQMVLYATPDADLTEQVIKAYESEK